MAPANPPVVFCSLSTTGLTLKSLETIYGIELRECCSGSAIRASDALCMPHRTTSSHREDEGLWLKICLNRLITR